MNNPGPRVLLFPPALLFLFAVFPYLSSAANQTHDVAMAFVGAPYFSNQSQSAFIGVMVSNLGDFNETVNASLSAYGNASCTAFSWTSFAVAPRRNQSSEFVVVFDCALNYSLVANASIPFDSNLSNNAAYSWVMVLPSATPTPSPTPTPTPTPPPNSCNDTDGGLNYYVEGTVYGYLNGFYYNYSDYCDSQISLVELYCSGVDYRSVSVSVLCNGTCANGACQNSSPTSPSPTITPSPSFSPSPSFNATPSPSPPPATPSPFSNSPTPSPCATPSALPGSGQAPETREKASEEKILLRISTKLGNAVLKVNVTDYAAGRTFEKTFPNPQNAFLELEKGFYEVSARAETSDGKILLAKPVDVNTSAGNAAIAPEFSPTGSVSVSLVSGEGVVPSGASVQAFCTDWRTPFSSVHNASSGKFLFNALPADVPCILLANSAVGESQQAQVSVKEGEEENISIRFEVVARKNFVEETVRNVLFVFGGLIAFAVTAYLLYARKKSGSRGAGASIAPAAPPHFEKPRPSHGMSAVLKTLNERDSAVVNYLLEHGGKASQGKIRFALLIPKTSFFRIIASLESRKIVETRKDGNFVEIRLTDWFKSL